MPARQLRQGRATHDIVGSQIGLTAPQSLALRHSTQRPVVVSQWGLATPQFASDAQDTQRPTRLQTEPADDTKEQALLSSSHSMQKPKSASQCGVAAGQAELFPSPWHEVTHCRKRHTLPKSQSESVPHSTHRWDTMSQRFPSPSATQCASAVQVTHVADARSQ
jgi:hypothetical protein